MLEVAVLVGGLLVGLGVGLLMARGRERALQARLAALERDLRERVLPPMERYARRLEIPVRSIPPLELDQSGKVVRGSTRTVEHLASLCEQITERETANSLALSDTVQMASKDVADVKKLRGA